MFCVAVAVIEVVAPYPLAVVLDRLSQDAFELIVQLFEIDPAVSVNEADPPLALNERVCGETLGQE